MGLRRLSPARECVSSHRSWDWAVRSEETEPSLSHSGALPPFSREGAGGVCVMNKVNDDKGLLALRGWICKDLS